MLSHWEMASNTDAEFCDELTAEILARHDEPVPQEYNIREIQFRAAFALLVSGSSFDDLRDHLGIDRNATYNEQPGFEVPRMGHIYATAEFLDVSVLWLLTGTGRGPKLCPDQIPKQTPCSHNGAANISGSLMVQGNSNILSFQPSDPMRDDLLRVWDRLPPKHRYKLLGLAYELEEERERISHTG